MERRSRRRRQDRPRWVDRSALADAGPRAAVTFAKHDLPGSVNGRQPRRNSWRGRYGRSERSRRCLTGGSRPGGTRSSNRGIPVRQQPYQRHRSEQQQDGLPPARDRGGPQRHFIGKPPEFSTRRLRQESAKLRFTRCARVCQDCASWQRLPSDEARDAEPHTPPSHCSSQWKDDQPDHDSEGIEAPRGS